MTEFKFLNIKMAFLKKKRHLFLPDVAVYNFFYFTSMKDDILE